MAFDFDIVRRDWQQELPMLVIAVLQCLPCHIKSNVARRTAVGRTSGFAPATRYVSVLIA
ncbi:MAG: hypothetical protein HZB47_08685 [Nitrosomonadales bacterium]|nr:hypothetical protein [Nitrosomonadales bacterium]